MQYAKGVLAHPLMKVTITNKYQGSFVFKHTDWLITTVHCSLALLLEETIYEAGPPVTAKSSRKSGEECLHHPLQGSHPHSHT